MYEFNDDDCDCRISYIIAYHENDKWHHVLGYSSIVKAKEELEKIMSRNPSVEYGIFQKIENITMNQLSLDFVDYMCKED